MPSLKLLDFLKFKHQHRLIMQYLKFHPSAPLKNFVECYFVWNCPSPVAMISVDTPPSAYTAMVFNMARPYKVALENDYIIELPDSYISGQSLKNYSLRIESEVEQIGIVFKPTGLFHLFDLPMYEFTNSRIDIQEVLRSDFRSVREKLIEQTNNAEKIKILEKILLKRLINKDPQFDGVDHGADQIINKFGNVSITELLDQSFMSRRKFERHFFQRVGLSPKYYARIRRFGYLCSLVAGQRNVSWSEVLHQLDYYDQSHFIKDFKEFSGKSPNQYLLTNNELAHSVSVKTIE
jgi:AraC-like DNA-binding protein